MGAGAAPLARPRGASSTPRPTVSSSSFERPARSSMPCSRTARRTRSSLAGRFATSSRTVRELVNGGLLVQAGSALADPIELATSEGDRLGGFEILAPVHLAADTEVYLARHDDGFAAIKIARPGTRRVMRRRLTMRGRGAARSRQRSRPGAAGGGAVAEVPYLALAWCAGVDADVAAAELRTDGEPGRRRLLDLVGRLLSAYATAHDAGSSTATRARGTCSSTGEDGDPDRLRARPRSGSDGRRRGSLRAAST